MNINNIIDNCVEIISKKYSKITKKTMIAVISILIGTAVLSIKSCNDKPKNEKIYLVDLDDEFENDAILKDSNGNTIEIETNDRSKLVAIVKVKKTSKDEEYETIIVNENGKLQKGFVDGKYLEDKLLDEEEVSFDIFEEISVVTPKSGAWWRKDSIVDKDTLDAELLKNNQEVVSSSYYIFNNDYEWKKVVYVSNLKDLKVGYVAKDYLMNKDFEKAEGKRFIVDSPKGLNLREDASTTSKIIDVLDNGTEVILMPNIASISDDNYDWFYVAYNKDNQIKYGYVAATYYSENSVINYLKLKEEKKSKEKKSNRENKTLNKIVDTSSQGCVNLKLRDKPGLNGKIIAEIENGTLVFTTENDLEESNKDKKVDNYKWIKISLSNGNSGYVAKKYLSDNVKTESTPSKSYNLDFYNEKNVEGYIGIDVPNFTNISSFKSLIKNNVSAKDDYIDVSGVKPEFVYIKLGATGYGYNKNNPHAVLSQKNSLYLDNVKSLAKICEEKNIPYGFYYYSQAMNEQDINKEVDFISEFLQNFATTSHNVLPFIIDVEESANGYQTRYYHSAQQNGKSYATDVINILMNKVRKINNIEVCLYTDQNTLKSVINFSELDLKNQQNAWVVDRSKTHSEGLKNNDTNTNLIENISIRQVALDQSYSSNGTSIGYDVNFMDSEYYSELKEKVKTKIQ